MFSRRALYTTLAWAGALLALFPASCSGHHEGLAASGGGGGASASSSTGSGGATSSVSSTASAQTSTATVSATSGGTGGMDAGPPGPTKVTVVDGVNDYSAIRICFTAYPSGAEVSPWPASASGLAFAHSAVIDPMSATIPSGVDVRPLVIAGDLAVTAGLTCTQILALAVPAGDAGAPPILAIPLPVLPANVFTSGKSLLLVPTGCLGGPAHTDPQQALACGMSYAPDAPTADLVALAMNRTIDPAHVALQAVQAAPTMPAVDLRLTPGSANAVEVQIAGSLTYGEAAPVPPFTGLARADYDSLPAVELKTYFPNTMYTSSVTPVSDVLANGNVKAAEFVDGVGFSLVAVGGYPGVPAGAWWHALTYALIRNDP